MGLPTERLADDGPRQIGDAARALMIFGRAGVRRVDLHAGSSWIIGREPPADVLLDDGSLSRQHARLTTDAAGALTIEDLDSTNGTEVNGVRVARGGVRVGDRVTLGAVTLALQPGAGAELALVLESHDRFSARLDEEVARARAFGRGLALLLIDARGPRGHVSGWADEVVGHLRPVDRLGLYAGNRLELLLPEASAEDAVGLAEELLTALEPRIGAGRLAIGVGLYPTDATSGDALLARCRRAIPAGSHGVQRAGTDDGERAGDEAAEPAPGERLRAVHAEADRLARSTISVLILGETGSGKEVLARRIHRRSPRASGPFRAVNCGALPRDLVESTLFGHERGAFTGADVERQGLLEAAAGGTLLLDEIGELPLEAQAALLRALDTRRITRVGGTEELPIDVRMLAATHRDVERMVADKTFRRDLLYRLNSAVLEVPPLRERRDELPALARHLVTRAARENDMLAPPTLDEQALELLLRHRWPGNVRELRNALERAVVVCLDGVITADDLPAGLRAPPPGAGPAARWQTVDEQLDFKELVQRYECELIVGALRACDWNQSAAARRLRIPRRTLVHKMKAFGLRKLGYAVADDREADEPPGKGER